MMLQSAAGVQTIVGRLRWAFWYGSGLAVGGLLLHGAHDMTTTSVPHFHH